MHRCNFIILDVGTVLMFLNTFHRDKDFEKNDIVKIIAKTGLKHFRWNLIVSIIQTSQFYMDLYFQIDVPDS